VKTKRGLWVQNVVLLGILVLLVGLYTFLPGQRAYAAGGGWETEGILALSATGETRVLLVDTRKKAMCVYRTRGLGEFRLVGARSFQYDVEIQDTAKEKAIEYKGINYFQVKNLYEQKMNPR
jgi:hypothetical protein